MQEKFFLLVFDMCRLRLGCYYVYIRDYAMTLPFSAALRVNKLRQLYLSNKK